MGDEVDNNYLPNSLFNLINEREDLKKKNFLDVNNERVLIRWIIRNCLEIYPELFIGNFKNNQIIRWLSSFCILKDFEKTPRIILAIWDLHPRHRKIWKGPNDKEYLKWLQINWYSLKIKLPSYNSFFSGEFFSISYLINKFLKYKNSNLHKNISAQIKIISALIFWLINLRKAKINLGYWSLITPKLSTLIIFILIGYFLRSSFGSSLLLFFGIGISYFQFFRGVAIEANSALKDYELLSIFPQIKPIDIFAAFTFLENFLTLFLVSLIICLNFFIDQEYSFINIFLFISSYLLLTIFCFSTGIFFRIISYAFPPFPKIMIWFNRVLFISSGAIFPINGLPQSIRPLVSWNPILQSIELSRGALDKNYYIDPQYISLNYLFLFVMYFLLFSLSLYSISERSLTRK